VYGAEDNHNKHQGYQSWSYYRDNFGIYDDDPEIITVTRAEFGEYTTPNYTALYVKFVL
jgi:DnaJ homolog subfamily C member 10